MKTLNPIQETAYLTGVSSTKYRQIMRIFFNEYEKMHYLLYKEEIFEELKDLEGYEYYTIEQMKLDLEVLVSWKNLIPIQDPKRVNTIAEYKNKQFRYSMSDYGVEIERLTIRLENLFMESGSLSTNYFIRIIEALEQTESISKKPLKDIGEWWQNLQEDFRRLNQNYQDYLREFYSGRADKIMKTLDFILYKDRFISYLREFIKELQTSAVKMEIVISRVSYLIEEKIITLVIKSELSVPHANAEKNEMRADKINEKIYGQWYSLKNWFITSDDRTSEVNQVMEITNEVIHKIIQNASLILQFQNSSISKKEEYKKYLSLFCETSDIGEAHKLSAHVFGVQSVHHYKINNDRSTDSINSSTYNEDPMVFMIKPHIRNYKPKIERTSIQNKSIEKLAQRNLYLKQAEADKQMVLKYIKNGKLDISEINDIISENTRNTLLRWISDANMTKSKTGITEFGGRFALLKNDNQCVLKCEDGELIMPVYILHFVGGNI